MSRNQDSKGKGKITGRGNANSKTKSYARGNAPIKKKSQAVKKSSNQDDTSLILVCVLDVKPMRILL